MESELWITFVNRLFFRNHMAMIANYCCNKWLLRKVNQACVKWCSLFFSLCFFGSIEHGLRVYLEYLRFSLDLFQLLQNFSKKENNCKQFKRFCASTRWPCETFSEFRSPIIEYFELTSYCYNFFPFFFLYVFGDNLDYSSWELKTW